MCVCVFGGSYYIIFISSIYRNKRHVCRIHVGMQVFLVSVDSIETPTCDFIHEADLVYGTLILHGTLFFGDPSGRSKIGRTKEGQGMRLLEIIHLEQVVECLETVRFICLLLLTNKS